LSPPSTRGRLRVAFLLPHLNAGGIERGIERVVLNLTRLLDGRRFASTLILRTRAGDLLPQVGADTRIVDLGSVRARWLPLALARCLHRLKPDVVYYGDERIRTDTDTERKSKPP